MKTLFLLLIISLLPVMGQAAQYTITISDIMEPVLQWEVDKRNTRTPLGSPPSPITAAELVQERFDNYLAERKGHFDRALERDRGKRLSDFLMANPDQRQAIESIIGTIP